MAVLIRDALLRSGRAHVLVDGGVIVDIDPSGNRLTTEDSPDVFDARGRLVLPGLVDNHVHFTSWALVRRLVDLHPCRSVEEVIALLRRQAPAGDAMLRGRGFQDGFFPSAPSKVALDAAFGDRPVALESHDGHSAWLSSSALALCGLADHPTGLLREGEAFRARRALPKTRAEDADAAVADAMADAAGRGITAIVDFEMDGCVAGWRRRDAAGDLALRVIAGVMRHELDAALDEGLRTGMAVGDGGTVTVGRLKLFADGALGSRTAYCDHAYPTTDGYHGERLLEPGDVAGFVDRARRGGLDASIHAIGDGAVRDVLDGFALAGDGASAACRVEHAQLVHDDDIARFASLGTVASVQPAHCPDDRDLADRWWAGETRRAFPFRSMLDLGARLAFGSDAPVAPLDPWLAIAAAVRRSGDDRPPWHPEQAVTVDEALDASTVTPELVVGADADLVVVDVDPRTVEPADLVSIPVAATMVAGRWTHRS